ncbi:MAG: hypothetical protein WDZ67_00025, partial [Patescibacteria group bacterium]
DKFYDGRTNGTDGDWLAWNAPWADFPKVSVGSSGSAGKTVSAKVDDDTPSGSYLIKVRVYDGKSSLESGSSNLRVTAAAISNVSASASEPGESEPVLTQEEVAGEWVESGSETLGAEAPAEKEDFQLNFYIIVGIFGLIVGGGGLVLGFRYLKNSSVAAR